MKNEIETESRAFSTRTLPIPVFTDDEILIEDTADRIPEPPAAEVPAVHELPVSEAEEAEEVYTGPRHARAASLEAFEETVEEPAEEVSAEEPEEEPSEPEEAPSEEKDEEQAEDPEEEETEEAEPLKEVQPVKLSPEESMLSRTSKLKPIGKVEALRINEKAPEVPVEKKKEPKAVVMPKKKNMKQVILHEALDFAKTLVVCGVCVFLLWTFIVRPVQVKGKSMYPTLTDNAIGLSNTIGYRLSGLERFDIAIIYLEEKDEYIVKRVIGLPGEKIRYENDQLYINDTPISEPFLDASYTALTEGSFTKDFEEITLGENEYFCMGDNRPHSQDSRYYGPFTKKQISSKGICILFPISEFGVKSW